MDKIYFRFEKIHLHRFSSVSLVEFLRDRFDDLVESQPDPIGQLLPAEVAGGALLAVTDLKKSKNGNTH